MDDRNIQARGERFVAAGGEVSDSTIITGDGNIVGKTIGGMTQVAGDLYQLFLNAPRLSRHIRGREFKTLVAERTRSFVGRDLVFRAINDLIGAPDFPSDYVVFASEPGIGKTALIAPCTYISAMVKVSARSLRNPFPSALGQEATFTHLRYSKGDIS